MRVIASNMGASIDSLGTYMQNFKERYDKALATGKYEDNFEILICFFGNFETSATHIF